MENQAALPTIPENSSKYEILGVASTATEEELRVAYRRLALLYHPDRRPEEEQEEAGKVFARIASAYATLSNPAERRRYDLALAQKQEFKEGAAVQYETSLSEILAGIDSYEHMFSEGSVRAISQQLDDIVQQSLIRELGEEVVEAWSLSAAPSGSQHKGSFKTGALVLTNLRVLFPFTYTWEERSGNVKTVYTGASMPILPLPRLETIAVIAKKRVKRTIWVHFHYAGGEVSIQPGTTSLSKLLLVAELWGIRVESQEQEARTAELRWALLRPWIWAGVLLGIIIAGAAVIGIFSDGMIDEVADLFDFFRHWGVLQIVVVSCGMLCAWRIWLWVQAYSATDLVRAAGQQLGREMRSDSFRAEVTAISKPTTS